MVLPCTFSLSLLSLTPLPPDPSFDDKMVTADFNYLLWFCVGDLTIAAAATDAGAAAHIPHGFGVHHIHMMTALPS